MQLLGGESENLMEFAKQATITEYVDEAFPPTCIVHGEVDDTVPLKESENLLKKIKAEGVTGELHTIPKCSHRIDDVVVSSITKTFLAKYLAEY